MAKTTRTDPYQTSTRNFGPSQPQRRAPVDDIDKAILLAVEKRDSICSRMAEGENLTAELIAATTELATRQFERDEIIREFFYGKRTQAPNEHVIISADRPVEYGTLDGNTIKVRS